jgi:nucleoside-diphosphate-sugar epimerase
MSTPHILVTGATGFIGRFLLAQLLAQGERVVVLLRRPEPQMAELQAWLAARGIDSHGLTAIQGDLAQPQAGISDWAALCAIDTLYHTGALFAWGLSAATARQVNVLGTQQLITALQTRSRLQRVIGLSGYMLTMHHHLSQAGVQLERPATTDWAQVYGRLGAYEASKIEAHFALIETCNRLGVAWTIVHPATVVGHSQTGEIFAHQQFSQLLTQLKEGKLAAIPATPAHRLPLVCVDDLVDVMIAASHDPHTIGQELLVADAQTPNLATVLEWAAAMMQVNAPKRYVPLRVLGVLLRWRWLAKQLNMSAEMLHFLRTEPLDTTLTDALRQRQGLMQPNLQQAVQHTALGLGGDRAINL